MLWPDTSTYPARPPSAWGRRNCAQKAHARMSRAIPATLFASRSDGLGTRTNATCAALALIVDHQLRPVAGRPVVRGTERRRRRARAAVGDPPTVVRGRALDERVDVDRHCDALRDVVRRTGGERRRGRAVGEARGAAEVRE